MDGTETRRYTGKFSIDEWKHKKTGTLCKRVRLTFPSEVLDNENFKLRIDRDVLITVNKDGTITLEPL